MPTIKIKPKKPTRQKTSSRITRSGKEVSKTKTVRGTGKSKTVVKKKVVTSPKGKTLKYKTKVKSPSGLDKSKRKDKTKITGDKSFSFSLFNFGRRN